MKRDDQPVLGTPFDQLVQNLKFEVHQTLSFYRQVFIHRTKFSTLANQLMAFHQSFIKRSLPNRVATPSETIYFRQMLNSISSLTDIMKQLTESNYIHFFQTHPFNYVYESLSSFRTKFDSLNNSLQLSQTTLLTDEAISLSEEISDNENLLQLLQSANTEQKSNISDENLIQLKEYLLKLKEESSQEHYKSAQISNSQTVLPSLQKYSSFILNRSNIKIINKVCTSGSFDFYEGYLTDSKKLVSIKQLHSSNLTPSIIEFFLHEIETHINTNHFAIAPFIGFTSTPPYFIITDYMAGGPLSLRLMRSITKYSDSQNDLSSSQPTLSNEKGLDGSKLTNIALGISSAMSYMHSKNILHYDLRSANIFLDENDFPKIMSFGLGSNIEGVKECAWMSPEILDRGEYSQKSDVYSFGVLLWEMLTGDIPFRGLSDAQIADIVITRDIRPLIPQSCSRNLARLISLCWDRDPMKRPDFETIFSIFSKIRFPWADRDQVDVYITWIKPLSDLDIDEPTTKTFSELLNQFCSSTMENRYASLMALMNLLNHDLLNNFTAENDEELFSSNVIEIIAETAEKCMSSKVAVMLFNLVSILISKKNEEFTQSLSKHFNLLISLYMRCGTTTMISFLDYLELCINQNSILFTKDHLVKFSKFLMVSDLEIRKRMIHIISKVIKGHLYNEQSSLCVIIPYLIKNISISLIWADLINCFILLSKIDVTRHEIADLNCQSFLLEICTSSDPNLVLSSYNLIDTIIDNEGISQIFINSLFSIVPRLLTGSEDFICHALSLIIRATPSKVNDQFIQAISHVFEMKNNPLITKNLLKVVYKVMNNAGPVPIWTPHIMNSLHSEDIGILILGGACIMILISKSSESNISELFDAKYLHNSLQILKNDNSDRKLGLKLQEIAVRLCGAFGCSRTGCSLLEQSNLVNEIVETDAEMALSALAAIAMTSPCSPVLRSAVSLAIQKETFRNSKFLVPILSNIAIHPEGAKLAASALDVALFGLKNGLEQSMHLIERIVTSPEAKGEIRNPEIVKDLATELNIISGKNRIHAIKILIKLAEIEEMKDIIKNVVDKEKITKEINNFETENATKTVLIQLLSRFCYIP